MNFSPRESTKTLKISLKNYKHPLFLKMILVKNSQKHIRLYQKKLLNFVHRKTPLLLSQKISLLS